MLRPTCEFWCACVGLRGLHAWQWGVAVGPSTWQLERGSVAVGAWQRGSRGVAVGRGSGTCHVAVGTATPYCHAYCHVAGATATPPLPRCHTPTAPDCHAALTATLPRPDCHSATPRLPHCHAPNHPTATLKAPQSHTGTPKLAQHVALNMYVCASAYHSWPRNVSKKD